MTMSRSAKARRILLMGAVTLLLVTRGMLAEEQSPDLQAFQPQWKAGQKWVVQTVTRQTQARRAPQPEHASKPMRWQFAIEAIEPWEGKACFRVSITSLLPGIQPETTLWVDQQTMTLRRIRMQIPSADGFRAIEETYRSPSGQPFPAFTPLTVPPVELPVFLSGIKGNASFQYQAVSGSEQAKALGDVGFGFTVEQSVDVPQPGDYPSLLPADAAKSLQGRPTVQVLLKSAQEQVRQVWQTGLPWPVFSDNGYARSMLVPDSGPLPESPSR